MPVDSSLLGNTNNTFQNTSNSEVLNKGCGQGSSLQGSSLQGSSLQGSSLQGGGGYSNTFKSLEQDSNNNMGKGYSSSENYSDCNKQGGGGLNGTELGTESHATSRFNHSSSGSYGFGKEGAAVAHELKGGYAAMTQNNDMNSCSGGRKRRRKSRKKKPKRKSKKRKSRRKSSKRKPKRKSKKRKPTRKSRKRKPRRKSRKRKPRRKSRKRKPRRKLRGGQKGGSSISYSSIDSGLTGNDARILGTNAALSSDANCGDGYNHYTGGNEKTVY